MESRNATMLESSGENTILIETVKNIVTQRERNESETEDFFLVSSQDQNEQFSEENAEETTSHKQETKEIFGWIHLCRTCANSYDNLIPIFEGEGAEHDLSSKILKYLPIHISESDSLPLQLCHPCAGTLLAWHDLSERCLSAERKLLKMQETLQKKQQYCSTSLDNVEVTATTPTVMSNTTNSQSEQQIDVKNGAHDTEEINNSNRLKDQIMHDWAAHSYSRQRYKKLAGKHINKIISIQTGTFNTLDKDSKNISSPPNNIANDQTSESSKMHLCEMNKSTTDKQKNKIIKEDSTLVRQTQVASSAKKTKNIPMRKCTAKMKNESNAACLEEDVKQYKTKKVTSIDDTAMICKSCNKKFSSRKSYWAHLRTHTGKKSYTCHICGKQFIQSGSMYYHLKHVHDGVKNHACDICGRSFAMKTAMEDHRRIHTGERPYVCHICGKTFKTKASLYIHSKTHTDEFPYKCIYCAKRFRWKQQMLGHLTVHTGEKNHMCDVCGKGFGVKNDLTRHKRIHSEEKPYTCQQCGISFSQKRYLKSHERLKLGTCGYSQESS